MLHASSTAALQGTYCTPPVITATACCCRITSFASCVCRQPKGPRDERGCESLNCFNLDRAICLTSAFVAQLLYRENEKDERWKMVIRSQEKKSKTFLLRSNYQSLIMFSAHVFATQHNTTQQFCFIVAKVFKRPSYAYCFLSSVNL